MAGLTRTNDLNIGRGLWLRTVSMIGIGFIIAPLLLLIVFSFNSSRSISTWSGFSLNWYEVAFKNGQMWIAFRNSLLIACASTAISTILGTSAALAIGRYSFRGKRLFESLLHVPIIMPEIMFGTALLVFFLMIRLPLGLVSIICAHITFSISFVTLIVLTKVREFDRNLEYACLDLGANPRQAFFDVLLPAISPGVVAGALFAFTLSIDDFIVTFFTAGPGSSTLPLKIYSVLKQGVTPEINAVSTILTLLTSSVVFVAALVEKGRLKPTTKRVLAGFVLGLLVIMLLVTTFFAKKPSELRILNYSDYLDPEIVADFEKESGVRVVVDYFNDNEELLSKLQLGASGYDLIVPTGYMVGIMIQQKLIQPLALSNVPNIKEVDPRFRELFYDPTGSYCIPYTYGFTGISYNSAQITEPIDSWKAMWDERYQGKISMLNDMREVFAVAYLMLGYPLNDTDPAHLQEALELLLRQKPILRKYESNIINDLLLSGDILLAQNWSGGLFKLNRDHPEFKFVMPKEGAMIFVDNFCIPKAAPNKPAAEQFLNYLLKPEVSARNMRSILYAMPVPAAQALLGPELRGNEILFPPVDDLTRYEIARDLGAFAGKLDKAWTELKGK